MNTRPTNTHQDLRDDLKAFADGELAFMRRLVVRRHLAQCSACQQELKAMEKLSQEIAATNEPAPLDAALRARLLQSAPQPAVTVDKPRPTVPRRMSLANLCAVGAVCVIAGIILFPVFGGRARENARRSTVFNVANNALTTDGGGSQNAEYYSRTPSAGAGLSSPVSPNADFRSQRSPQEYQTKSPVSAGGSPELPTALRRVHKEARIGVAVDDAEAASDAVVTLVKGAGGFIAGNTLTSGERNSKTAALELRVPVARFETILAQIGKLGEVRSKNVSGEDITAQVSDADQSARILSNDLSIREAQIRARQQKATRNKPFVLSWEQRAELRSLRIQAAQARARLELLKKTSELSNISVQLLENARPAGQGGFLENISDTGTAATQSFLLAARLPIQLIIWILAYSPLWLPALLAWRFYLKKEKQRAV